MENDEWKISFLPPTGLPYVAKAEVQPEHFVAAIGIADRQYGQSLVVAASSRFRLFTAFTIRKITKATIRKPMTSLRKAP